MALSEAIGKLQTQLEAPSIQKVHIECAGSMAENISIKQINC